MTRRPADHALIRRLRAGDRGAWDAIDRRYRPELERFARRMLFDVAPDQVDDVVQEALWRAHRALHRDERVIELRPWLYRLTRNCCLDERARVRTDAVELAPGAARPRGRAGGDGRATHGAADAARRPRAAARAAAARVAAARARRRLARGAGRRARAQPRRDAQPRAPGARGAHARRRGPHARVHRRPPGHLRRLRPPPPADGAHAPPPRGLPCLPHAADRAARPAPAARRARAAGRAAGPARCRSAEAALLGSHAKATTVASTLVLAAGVSVELFEAGGPAPMAVASIALPGNALAAGSPIPPGTAIVRRAVAYPGRALGRAGLPRRPAPRGPAAAARRAGQRALRGHDDRRRPGRARRPHRRRAGARDGGRALPPPGRAGLDRRRLPRALAARGHHRAQGERTARRARLGGAARERQHGRAGGRRAPRDTAGHGS